MIAKCKVLEITHQFLSILLMGSGPPQKYFGSLCYFSRVYFKGNQVMEWALVLIILEF